MSTPIFLTPAEIAELTGIRQGSAGKTKTQRQAIALKSMGVPHYVNAAGLPIVARATIEGVGAAMNKSALQAMDAWDPVTH